MPKPPDRTVNTKGQAREPRAKVSLECEVRQGTRPWKKAQLDEISPSGFRMARFPDFSEQLPLRIRIPGLQLLNAHVRWQKGNAVGCEFTAPLHVAVFEHIVRQSRGG